jgi:hypothetical protein
MTARKLYQSYPMNRELYVFRDAMYGNALYIEQYTDDAKIRFDFMLAHFDDNGWYMTVDRVVI